MIVNFVDQVSQAFYTYFLTPVKNISLFDVIDILLLSAVFYCVVVFVRNRRARTMIVGLVALAVIYFLTWLLELRAAYALFHALFDAYMIFIVIIFQYDLRDALDKIGTRVLRLHRFGSQAHTVANITSTVGILSEAACELSKEKCGALIVVERSSKLGDYIKTGVELDAMLSCELLGNLFFNRSPLHDGAVIIRDGKVCAAGCILPSSKSSDVPKDLGTRHRAAVGISEQSDAVVIVVSEETGTISVVNNGVLKRGYNSGTLKDDLFMLLTGGTEQENARILESFQKTEKTEAEAEAEEDRQGGSHAS